MRKFLLCLIPLLLTVSAQAQTSDDIASAAKFRTQQFVLYDPAYVTLKYPNGDVPKRTGVCTDVIIRSYRAALNFDFQKAVHEDMKSDFSAYPKIWGLKRPDKNIDHRRVPNLETYLTRMDASLAITKNPKDYMPGDIVSWRLFRGGTPHIGIVTDRKSPAGVPLIAHNIGFGPKEDDILFNYDINGHFRFNPDANLPDVQAESVDSGSQ